MTSLDDEVHVAYLRDSGHDVVAAVTSHAHHLAPLLADHDLAALVQRVLRRVRGLGLLDELLSDDSITDVMVNGRSVWVERRGLLERAGEIAEQEAHRLIERIVAPLGLRVDRSSPIVDARLPDGSRLHAIVPPLAVDGPCLTIRRFRARPVTLEQFTTPPVAALLGAAVVERRNIVVTGGTGSGKTTMLNALAAHIDDNERVITIEDAAELRLDRSHVVRLEARPASVEGVGAVTIRELVKTALRMRPNRIIVGEVRGGEALDMLQAMNTGHEGSMSTCHANSPADAMRRLETMMLFGESTLPLAALREQLAASIDVIVQVTRSATGQRRVARVCEVTDDDSRVRTLCDGDRVVGQWSRPARGQC